jgi:hypothetical protein
VGERADLLSWTGSSKGSGPSAVTGPTALLDHQGATRPLSVTSGLFCGNDALAYDWFRRLDRPTDLWPALWLRDGLANAVAVANEGQRCLLALLS